jgi:hypothetical protein
VAEFGTRFVTRCGTHATQVPEKEEKESGGEGGIRTTDETLEIKMLLENCGLLVPSRPLASSFVPVDSASSRVRRYFPRNLDLLLIVRPDYASSIDGRSFCPPHSIGRARFTRKAFAALVFNLL